MTSRINDLKVSLSSNLLYEFVLLTGALALTALPPTRHDVAQYFLQHEAGSVMDLFSYQKSDGQVKVRATTGHGRQQDHHYICEATQKLVGNSWVDRKCAKPLKGADIFKRHLKSVHLGISRVGNSSLNLDKWAKGTPLLPKSTAAHTLTLYTQKFVAIVSLAK